MPLPLEGIRVLDVTQVMAGPFCTMLLADMGANVIKIEKPGGGDSIRKIGPPFINGESAAFLAINRNKRSIVLDLKTEKGVEILSGMAEKADIIVQNMSPGSMDRLGLGYDQIHSINPSMIYCSISGHGATGPDNYKPGFDLVAQGLSGLMHLTGYDDDMPTKVGVPITDLNAGMYATYGILSAYIHRLKTGKGQHVDTSLLESGIAYTIWESAIFFATGTDPGASGTSHPLIAPYQAFSTNDGHINVGAANQSKWKQLCVAIERLDLLDDHRFASNALRMENKKHLEEILGEVFQSQGTEHWVKVLEKAGVPCGAILKLSQSYSSAQMKEREMSINIQHPTAGMVRNIGIPVKLSQTPGSIRRAAPTYGQHTDEILQEFGHQKKDLFALREKEIIT